VEERGFELRTSPRCARECLAFAKELEAQGAVSEISAGAAAAEETTRLHTPGNGLTRATAPRRPHQIADRLWTLGEMRLHMSSDHAAIPLRQRGPKCCPCCLTGARELNA
jgi:hypothetical protein